MSARSAGATSACAPGAPSLRKSRAPGAQEQAAAELDAPRRRRRADPQHAAHRRARVIVERVEVAGARHVDPRLDAAARVGVVRARRAGQLDAGRARAHR